MRKRRLRQRITGIIICIVLAACLIPRPSKSNMPQERQQSTTEAQSKLERITVQTTPPCSSGRITVYAENERVFDYYGKIQIINSGWNGRPIKIIVNTTGASHE